MSDREALVRELLLLSRETLLARADVVERAAVALLTSGTISDVLLAEARTNAHQLVSLGVFGIERGAQLAVRAEQLLGGDLGPATGPALAEAALGIREAINAGTTAPATGLPGAPATDEGGTRVLLVEDDELMVDLLTRALTTAGCLVEHAPDGVAALAALGQEPLPRLVLLDIDLPGLDGFSVLRGLRDRGVLDRVKVLVLSARGSEHDVLGALELGAVDHVAKPFSLPVLMARVEQLTGRS